MNTAGKLKKTKTQILLKDLRRDKALLVMIFPVILYFLLFHYRPMYGVIIAFKRFSPGLGIWGSPWRGFFYFEMFFSSVYFFRLIRNTFLLSLYSLVWGWPFPIGFALILNEIKHKTYKRVIQTISYLPHFISVVIICGMIVSFLSPRLGLLGQIIRFFGGEPVNYLMDAKYFRTIYIASGIWQGFGWGSIIYLAAMSNLNVELYEAAIIDGANRIKRIIYITIPGIAPTIIILLILNLGSLMSVGFEKVLLLYNPATYEVSDVISTFTYRQGLLDLNYSYASAVGLFNSLVNLVLLIIFNYLSRKAFETSLW